MRAFDETEGAIIQLLNGMKADSAGLLAETSILTAAISLLEITRERLLEYEEILEQRKQNAVNPDVKKLYDKYAKKIRYGSTTEKNAYYNPIFNGVYLDTADDLDNPRGAGSTHYHEVGHMVDDYTKWFGDSSSSKAFSKSLKNDFENYVDTVMKDNKGSCRSYHYATDPSNQPSE